MMYFSTAAVTSLFASSCYCILMCMSRILICSWSYSFTVVSLLNFFPSSVQFPQQCVILFVKSFWSFVNFNSILYIPFFLSGPRPDSVTQKLCPDETAYWVSVEIIWWSSTWERLWSSDYSYRFLILRIFFTFFTSISLFCFNCELYMVFKLSRNGFSCCFPHDQMTGESSEFQTN